MRPKFSYHRPSNSVFSIFDYLKFRSLSIPTFLFAESLLKINDLAVEVNSRFGKQAYLKNYYHEY